MGGGREVNKDGTYVYLCLIYVDVWQKQTHYCEAIIFQYKINKFEKEQKILKNRTKVRTHIHTKYANWIKQVIAARGSMELEHSAYTHTPVLYWNSGAIQSKIHEQSPLIHFSLLSINSTSNMCENTSHV